MTDQTPLSLAPPPGAHIAIAGGCGAFGRALVAGCRAAGLRVTVLDLPASLERHPVPDPAAAIPCDVRDAEDVARAFRDLGDRAGSLDGFVYLVGYTVTPPPRLDDIDPAQWDDIHDGNLRGAFLTAKAALPLLRNAPAGAIVLVSSGLAYAARPGFGPYVAAKAGLVGLTRALAIENAPSIRANAVAPSVSETAFLGGGTGRGGEDSAWDWFHETHATPPPLGRNCLPEDVVGPVLFLLGGASAFMTGQVLHVNGGRIML